MKKIIRLRPADEPHKTTGQLNNILFTTLHFLFHKTKIARPPHSVRLDVLLSWTNTFGIYNSYTYTFVDRRRILSSSTLLRPPQQYQAYLAVC